MAAFTQSCAALLLVLAPSGCDALGPPPSVTLRALHRVPPSSTASYLILPPKTVQLRAVVSWQASAAADGWLLMVSVRSDAEPIDANAWSSWEPAATLMADETSYVITAEPGLCYKFRVAGLSNTEGQLPFSEATLPISALGDPTLAVSADLGTTNSKPSVLEAYESLWSSPPPTAVPSPSAEDVMPWDSPGLAAAPPPPAPPPADDLRSDVWSSSEQHPLLSMVPATAELALLQAQSSLAAAVRAGGSRLRVELQPPGLNPALDGSHPVSEPLLGFTAISLVEVLRGMRVNVIFPSAGNAAAAQRAYERFSGRLAACTLGGITGAVTRDAIASGVDFTPGIVDANDPADVYLFVAPSNSRGDAVALAVQQAVDKVPGACFVLLNPDLEDTVLSSVFGITTSDAVRKSVAEFATCYYYKGAFRMLRPANRPLECGCLLHQHGGQWVAHELRSEGFEELARWDEQPSREQFAALRW